MSQGNVKERKMGKKKMVGGVPMATIYQGMNLHRLEGLNNLESDAWFDACDTHNPGTPEFRAQYEANFEKLCARYATKAGWHADHKTTTSK